MPLPPPPPQTKNQKTTAENTDRLGGLDVQNKVSQRLFGEKKLPCGNHTILLAVMRPAEYCKPAVQNMVVFCHCVTVTSPRDKSSVVKEFKEL